jgi:hypothetical protein
MCFAFALARGHGIPGAHGLDAVEQPHRAARRARGDLELRVEPAGMLALGWGGVFGEPDCVSD